MNLTKNKIIISGFLACILFIIYNSVYTVPEGYIALLSSSSKPKSNLSNPELLQQPGLHFKLPFLVQAIPIDMRLHSVSFKKLTLTLDKQPLVVDYYARWHITQPTLYYLQTHNDREEIKQALTQKLNTLLQHEFSHDPSKETMTNELPSKVNTVIAEANKPFKKLGITLIDIGFKSIDFPTETNTLIVKKMRIEQAHIALLQRAMGKANAENIRSTAVREAALQLANAKKEADLIRAKADADAAEIYNKAYHKNHSFADFYLTLEAYRKGFMSPSSSNKNFLVINTKDDFFKTIKETSKRYHNNTS